MWRNWMLVPALVLVLTLSACGGTASSTEEEAAQGELSEARVEAAGRPLSEEEIISAYDRAVTAYSWFVVSPLPDTGQTVSQDGPHIPPGRRDGGAGGSADLSQRSLCP